ncbi:surface-anchored fimbrial subunit [Corynebacterium renale]|uniref:SpaH/EbpB family LPXTG-anchored major pilin n=1 Tax=Corynebacterium renale TaxID=1724 RepID=UPI000DA3F28C|nr:SpaH/EbpB family LPXTG-anchored major pilin [Corynebacterium renale]SQG65360.1 surface-anchored fimbrial subunit [Corynebacterium renale]
MSRIARKSFALALAASVATITPVALSAGSFAPVAMAQSNAQNNQAVDLNADVRLTIDKRVGDPGAEGTTAIPNDASSFTVERVQMTNALNTAAGWQEASDIVAAGADQATVTGEATTVPVTGGTAVFNDLSVGLYKVTETVNGNYTVAAPFLVTLPLTKDDGTLDYTPTITPKNQLIEPKKNAADTNASVGDNITYTITAPVPAGDVNRDGERTISQFAIDDQLVDNLTYANNTATVTLTGGGDGGATLTEGDYTLTTSDNQVQVAFTEDGLQKLATARADNPGLAVELTFDATVKSIPANGQITNQANVTLPNRDEPVQTTPDDTEDSENGSTATRYVDVQITKTLNGQNIEDGKNGNDAQFQIFECTATTGEGQAYSIADGATALEGTNQEGTAKAGTTLTAQGEAPAAAVANGYALQFDPEKQYCAVETKAPEGYLLNPDPVALTLDTNVAQGQRPVYVAQVDNIKNNIWGMLPATGERTMLIILAAGLLLFGAGAAYQLRRKNSAQA